MAQPPALSGGALQRILDSNSTAERPYVQLVEFKPINSGSTSRSRIIISDGVNCGVCFFSGPLQARVDGGEFPLYSIFHIKSYVINSVSTGRRVIMISELDLICRWPEKIGNPIMLREGKTQAPENAAGPVVAHHVPAPMPSMPMAAPAAPHHQQQQQQEQYHQQAPPQQQYHQQAPPQQQQQQSYGGGGGGGALGSRAGAGAGGPTVTAGFSGSVMPITSLTTFTQRWTIKGRVTNKGDVKTWSNQRGQGKLFSVTIVDEGNAEIRATFFQAAVDRFFPMLEVGKVYYFGNGKIKLANTQYTSVKNSLEISFDEKAQVQTAADDSRISKAVYNFTKLDVLSRVEPNKMIDVIGVVVQAGEPTTIKTKAKGENLDKRDFVIADDSGTIGGCTVSLTFWGQQAQSLEAAPGQIIAAKGVKVGEYGGRSLSSMMGSTVTVDSDIPEAHRIRAWYNKYSTEHGGNFAGLKANTERGGGVWVVMVLMAGAIGPLSVIESRVVANQLRDDTTGGGRGNTAGSEGAIYITKGTLFAIRRDEPGKLWYPACNGVRGGGDGGAGPIDESKRCNKKLTHEDGDGGQWRCQAGCFNPVPNYRYIASATVIDHSGQEYVTMFDAEAEMVLKRKANEIQTICARSGGEAAGLPAEAEAIFQEALGKEYLFSCKAKMQEASNGREARVQVSVVKVRELDPLKECKALLNSLRQYAALQQQETGMGGGAM